MTLAVDADGWADTNWTVSTTERHLARHLTGPEVLLLDYDQSWTAEFMAQLCNLSRVDGAVCRRFQDHDGPHIPMNGELVVQSGIYVVDLYDTEPDLSTPDLTMDSGRLE